MKPEATPSIFPQMNVYLKSSRFYLARVISRQSLYTNMFQRIPSNMLNPWRTQDANAHNYIISLDGRCILFSIYYFTRIVKII